MIVSDQFRDLLPELKAGTILLLAQTALTFAVLSNVYAIIDSYTRQIDVDSGYVDEDTLLGISIRLYGDEGSADQAVAGIRRNQIAADVDVMPSWARATSLTPRIERITSTSAAIWFLRIPATA